MNGLDAAIGLVIMTAIFLLISFIPDRALDHPNSSEDHDVAL